MVDLPKHSVSVSGVVVGADDRVLVIRRADNGHGEAPGGVLELNESFEEGVRREVAEETGLTARVGPLTGVYKNLVGGIVALVFRCVPEVEGDSPHPTAEAREVTWMTVDQVREAMVPAFAVRVFDALNRDRPRAAVRAHDGVNLT